jgi:hypothetical protein
MHFLNFSQKTTVLKRIHFALNFQREMRKLIDSTLGNAKFMKF